MEHTQRVGASPRIISQTANLNYVNDHLLQLSLSIVQTHKDTLEREWFVMNWQPFLNWSMKKREM